MEAEQTTPPFIEGPNPPKPGGGSGVKKAAGPLAVIGALLLKFKVALIPILKFFPFILKTGGTMFISIWVYAMAWGWWFAFGFVVLIFVHECGHLLAAKRVGLKVGAPVFIPFMGAIIALKEAPRNAWIEAQVGIGGPLLGPSSYFMKSPPVQYTDDVCHEMVEAFAAGDPGPVWPEA